jgi:hypothetical protein
LGHLIPGRTTGPFIGQGDLLKEAPKTWFRPAPGAEVGLRGSCHATCQEVIKDAAGTSVELRFQFDLAGYFAVDMDSIADRPVFNQTVGLKDS